MNRSAEQRQLVAKCSLRLWKLACKPFAQMGTFTTITLEASKLYSSPSLVAVAPAHLWMKAASFLVLSSAVSSRRLWTYKPPAFHYERRMKEQEKLSKQEDSGRGGGIISRLAFLTWSSLLLIFCIISSELFWRSDSFISLSLTSNSFCYKAQVKEVTPQTW